MTETTTAYLLAAARELISDPKDWRKGFPHPGSVTSAPYCAGAAIDLAGMNTAREVVTEAKAALLEAAGAHTCFVHQWNDAPARTHEDVLTAFDQAIEGAVAS